MLAWPGLTAAVIGAYMTGLFLLALARRDNSIADIAWGPGFILVTVLHLVLSPAPTLRQGFASGLVLIWAVRLALHIGRRAKGRGEDYRYAAWRKSWGRLFVLRSYLQVFLLQGAFLFLIALPLPILHAAPSTPWTALDAAGLALWIFGFACESAADAQLTRFRKSPPPRPRYLTTGLWGWSRHPNYFGEAIQWWGLFLIAAAAPGGWRAVVSPLVITLLLRFVSGVPLLERKHKDDPAFQAYAARTNAFWPWFPKAKR